MTDLARQARALATNMIRCILAHYRLAWRIARSDARRWHKWETWRTKGVCE